MTSGIFGVFWRIDWCFASAKMGFMKFPRVGFRILPRLALLLPLPLLAQSPASTNQLLSGDDLLRVVMTNAFNPEKTFSGVAMVHMDDDAMPMDIQLGISAQDGDVRVYLDKTKVQGDPIFVQAAKMNLREGLAHVVTLFKKDDPGRYIIFPDRRMFKHTDESLSFQKPVDLGEPFHLESVVNGVEPVDNHICRKIEVRCVTKTSSRIAATIWRATDLDDAPLKGVLDISQSIKIRFLNIRTTRLNTNLFEVPQGYAEFQGSYYAPQFIKPQPLKPKTGPETNIISK